MSLHTANIVLAVVFFALGVFVMYVVHSANSLDADAEKARMLRTVDEMVNQDLHELNVRRGREARQRSRVPPTGNGAPAEWWHAWFEEDDRIRRLGAAQQKGEQQ